MAQIFNIQDDKVVINSLVLKSTEGSVVHSGDIKINGETSVKSNLSVDGVIFAEEIHVKKLVSNAPAQSSADHVWRGEAELDLNGKGLNWVWGEQLTQFIYRTGNRIWTNTSIDLASDQSYNINNLPVISINALGPQVTKSNLKEVGNLRSLRVNGDTTLSDFAFFNSTVGRLGLNTDEPSSTFSVLDDVGAEVVIGTVNELTSIGTYTNNDLTFITDGIPRVTIKNTGPVIFGAEKSPIDVVINGTLKVDSIIADNRIERTTPLEFKPTRDNGVFNQGLIWSGSDSIKSLLLKPDPVRIWSSEAYDTEKEYYAQGYQVLNKDTLGETVVNSSLTSVGTLTSLKVNGNVEIDDTITTAVLRSSDGTNFIAVEPSRIISNNQVSLYVANDEVYYGNSSEIIIGNKLNTTRPVKLFGPVSVGTNNIDPTVSLTVSGDMSVNNKKFTNGNQIPTSGEFTKGDICWNQDPKEGGYIGWVCIANGSPGVWAPFGVIGKM